jgi:DeoR family transcriptional regulator, glycerol-3-phosphate regulon repressor
LFFINTGTTTEAVASALSCHHRLRVITNKLNLASIVGAKENPEVIVTGDLLRHRGWRIINEAAIGFVGQFRVD